MNQLSFIFHNNPPILVCSINILIPIKLILNFNNYFYDFFLYESFLSSIIYKSFSQLKTRFLVLYTFLVLQIKTQGIPITKNAIK